MPHDRFLSQLTSELAALDARGNPKRHELVIEEVVPATGGFGPRYRVAGQSANGGLFLKMNSNNYLGMNLRPEVIAAEEEASRRFGAGPGAVRFISGTYAPHVELEASLAAFHGREAAMIFSSAYATMLGVFTPLVSSETALVSDELNHNCIINAIRLARPKEKRVYRHNDMADFAARLAEVRGCRRVLVVTDGIFSMRGDAAPLGELLAIARGADAEFAENVVVIVDDSHGVGAYGATGRGTEEASGSGASDILIGTLGKALGVNGGYVVGPRTLIDFLRESAPTYIYSNPITPAEAAAARAAVAVLTGPDGSGLLAHLAAMTARFRDGLIRLGFETLPGTHPVVPLFVRDTPRTTKLVRHLLDHGVLATGLNYPVVPKGDETIRFQVSADHTEADIDSVLDVLSRFAA
ncbi:MAG: aminotransferase class I/II-fold pyridoxal phosphate-dependent enzyme [Thermoanaerobaculia bacterium]